MSISCHHSHEVLERERERDNTHRCCKMVNNSNGDAGITGPAADGHSQRVADEGLEVPL